MPDLHPYLDWIENTWISVLIRDGNLFPAIELVHLFGIVALMSATLALDLRLMDCWLRRWRVSALMSGLMPWVWIAFAVMISTGTGLFISDPNRFFYNPSFRIKLALIALAGLNALLFQVTALRTVKRWDVNAATSWGAKIAGFLSLVLWFGVVAAGRWIAFV